MKKVTKNKIAEIINDSLNGLYITPKNYDDDLINLGMDSISFIQVVVELEKYFNCEIPDVYLQIMQMNTINKIFAVLNTLFKKQG